MTPYLYTILKAAHVAAVLVFVSGVVATSLFLASVRTPEPQAIAVMMRWDRRVTTPAMLLVWAFGLGLAITGHWFPASWLIAKIGFVTLISAAHGVNSGRLRRRTDARREPVQGVYATLVLGAAALAALLVLVKPF